MFETCAQVLHERISYLGCNVSGCTLHGVTNEHERTFTFLGIPVVPDWTTCPGSNYDSMYLHGLNYVPSEGNSL